MSLSTKCPACGKVLKLKSEAAVGRKVPCPGCQEPFVVKLLRAPQKPAPVEDEYDADEYGTYEYGEEDYGDYDEAGGYDEYEAPARSSQKSDGSSRKSSKKKKKQAGAAWLRPLLIGGGALLGLALVATVITYAVSNFGGADVSNVVDLRYQPENCETFMIVRPASMANSPLAVAVSEIPMLKQLMDAQQQQQQAGTAKFSDIELVVVALTGISGRPQLSMPGMGFGASAGSREAKPLVVCSMARDITTDELKNYMTMPGVAAGGELTEKQHNSKTYYEAITPQGTVGVWQPDLRTLVMGTSEMVTAAIDRGPTEPRIARLDFIDASQHLLLVVAPPSIAPSATTSSNSTSGAPGSPEQRLTTAANKNVRAMAIGLTLSSDIEFDIRAACFGGSEAAGFKSTIDSIIAEAKSKAEAGLTSAPPGTESLVAVAKETLASIQSTTSGDTVDLSVKVPGKLVDAIKAAIDANPMASMMLDMALKQAAAAQGQPAMPGAFPGQSPGGAVSPGASPGTMPGTSPGFAPQEASVTVQSKNKMKQIALAMHNYHATFNRFPNAVSPEDNDQPLLSWRVQILPFLGEAELFNKFRMNEPWDSPNNLPLASQMPDIFRIPGSSLADGQTCYVTLRGVGTAFPTDGKAASMRDTIDGTSNTILVVEAAADRAVAWTRPDDLNFDPASPRNGLFGMRSEGALVVLCDGSVRTIRNEVDDETIRRLVIRNDSQPIDPSAF